MSVNDNAVMLMRLNADNGSVSPMTPSPSRVRGIRLFRAISRKLARRSREDLTEDDSRSSSSDSCSSTSVGRCSRPRKPETNSSVESGFRSASPHRISSSSSDAGSDTQSRNRHHHSTSADSIRKVFQNLTMNTRSHSCTNTKDKRKNIKKSAPKKILRAPVTYTYVKGLSGLPTQRIPKTIPRVYMNSPCGCSMQYMAGLHR